MHKFITVVLALLLSATSAAAAQKVAILPFDLRDVSQEGEVVPQYQPEDLRRLKVVADELKALMGKDQRFEVLDLTPFAADIEKAAPFSKCDGCDQEIGQKAGSDLVVTGFVDKWSDALISLQLFVKNVKTGEMVKSMSAEVRGNTDELWLHGLRWLWRNRLSPEEMKN